MSVVFPLSPPTGHHTAQKTKMGVWNTAGMSVSPYTGSQQVYQWPGEGWKIDVALRPMKAVDAEPWIAFLTSLRGQYGTFLWGDTARKAPQGAVDNVHARHATGSLNVAGADSLVTNFYSQASVTGILKAGDYIQLTASGCPQRLYKALTDINTDSSANATIPIFPRLRETVPDATSFSVLNCQGTFRLAKNQQEWDIDQALVYGIQFSALEALTV
jgi:hypothetical protein